MGMRMKIAGAALLAFGVSQSAMAQSMPGDNVVLQWNEVTISNIIAATGQPTVAARALGEVATAMYDAWSAFDPLAVPTQPGNGVGKASAALLADPQAKLKAISYAAYRVEKDLYPLLPAPGAADTLMASLGYDPTDTSADPTTPSGIGNLAAAAIIAFRHNDGSNQTGSLHTGAYSDYTGYVPHNPPFIVGSATNPPAPYPNAWQPLEITSPSGAVTIQKYVTPFWGAVTPFSPLPTFSGTGPSRYPSFLYEADALTILAYSAGLNDTTKTIAEYWGDFAGSQLPPGHWSRIGEYVSRRDGHSVDADAQMFFALNNALMDAGIAAWANKYTFNSERPITAVHTLFAGKPVYAWAGPGKGAQWIDGGTWLPYQPANVVTPAFPEYTSGHSTFSFAGAAVLQRFTGSDNFGGSVTIPQGASLVEPGLVPANPVTLNFPTFSSAASQAGLSRRYGGIHFIAGDLNGRADGYAVGTNDWAAAVTYFNGGKPCVYGSAPGSQSPWCSTVWNQASNFIYGSGFNGFVWPMPFLPFASNGHGSNDND